MSSMSEIEEIQKLFRVLSTRSLLLEIRVNNLKWLFTRTRVSIGLVVSLVQIINIFRNNLNQIKTKKIFPIKLSKNMTQIRNSQISSKIKTKNEIFRLLRNLIFKILKRKHSVVKIEFTTPLLRITCFCC